MILVNKICILTTRIFGRDPTVNLKLNRHPQGGGGVSRGFCRPPIVVVSDSKSVRGTYLKYVPTSLHVFHTTSTYYLWGRTSRVPVQYVLVLVLVSNIMLSLFDIALLILTDNFSHIFFFIFLTFTILKSLEILVLAARGNLPFLT